MLSNAFARSGCSALRACSAASSSPISVPTAGRTSPCISCAFQFVQRAGSNQLSIAIPACGSSATTAGTWRGATLAAKRNQRTSSALRRTGASHSCATLRRGSARFTQYVLPPVSTRHRLGRHAGHHRRERRARYAEQRFGAARQIGVDQTRIQRPKTSRKPATALSIAGLHCRKLPAHREEIVDQSVEAHVVHRHTGRLQLVGVRLAFVAQRIELGGQDQRGRQLREVLRVQRRRHRVGSFRGVRQVVVPEPLHAGARQQIAIGVGAVRSRIEVGVGDRIHEQLKRDRGAVSVARHLAHDRGEVAAGAVAADREFVCIAVQRRGVLGGPLRGRVAVVRRPPEIDVRARADSPPTRRHSRPRCRHSRALDCRPSRGRRSPSRRRGN